MKIKAPLTLAHIETKENFQRFVSQTFEIIIGVINGQLSFQDNLNVKILTVKFDQANTEQSVKHGLGFIPNGYIQVGSTSGLNLYDGVSKNTSDIIYLRSSAIATAKVMIF